MSSDELVKIRHHLHSIAEVSGKEDDTAEFIIGKLQSCNPDELITEVGGNGIIALFKGEKEGPRVLMRCELDALPVAEENDMEYVSKNEGVGHKCGHDGHMTIILGVARRLSEKKISRGEVILLFQPAEETGKGAKQVLEDEKFENIKPGYVFALHNIPGYEKHKVIVKNGVFAAASVGCIARLKGETAHAAHPEQGKSPALAVAQLIQSLSALPQFHTPLEKVAKATIVQAHIGEQAFGTSPGYGEVMATLRTFDDAVLENLKSRTINIANGIAQTYGLELDTEWVEPFPATINGGEAIEFVRSAASSNDIALVEKPEPFGWSEDFGHFTDRFEGALFGLGSGKDQPALHASDYDFPDEIIETGVKMFTGIINQLTEE